MIITTWGRAACGKSTAAANLALTLSASRRMVGIISSNLQYGHIQSLFGQTIHTKHGTYRAIDENEAYAHFWKSGVDDNVFLLAVPNEYSGLDFEHITLEQAENLITQALPHFDDLIIDGSEQLGNPVSDVGLAMSDRILLLHKPSVASCSWYTSKSEVSRLLKIDDKITHILSAYDNSCSIEAYREKTGVTFDFELPFVSEMPSLENAGTPITLTNQRSAKDYKAALENIVKKVILNYAE
ncbi:hypothetical protein FACS1894217_15310 [Clostridia bacterium]|nr:hypothetical protein FACS1894217_15310 [Clostridia bacterium]